MIIAILGIGRMGSSLARRLAGRADVILGARDPAAIAALATETGFAAVTYAEATAAADLVVIAVPYGEAQRLAATLDLGGKIVVDMSNPMLPELVGLSTPPGYSAGEEVQRAAPAARVVKAFNTIFAHLFALPREATACLPVLIAGDDPAAVDAVVELAQAAGFAAERTGSLENARLLESLCLLMCRFAYQWGNGPHLAPGFIRAAA